MVTLAYFIIFILMSLVVTVVDMAVSKTNFIESFQALFSERIVVIVVIVVAILTLIICIIMDFRLSKNKANQQSK